MTKETYEMIEDFLSEETQMYNYTDDEINLTEQDRQEATQLLKEITWMPERTANAIFCACWINIVALKQNRLSKRNLESPIRGKIG